MPRRLFLLVLLALSFVRLGAQAPDASFADLADSAAVVVTGRVAGVAVGADAGAIYTYATVTVGEVLKGRVADGTLVVKQLGGTLPTLGLYIADQASFAPQEDVLLFLNVRPRDGTLYTVGLSRGKWRLLPDLATGGVSAVQGSARVPLDQAARRAVGASRAQSDAFVATPPEFDLARPNFTFIPGSEGGPARWHEADDGARIAIDFQDGTDLARFDTGFGRWNAVGTRLQLQRGQSGPAPTTGCFDFADSHTVRFYWNDPCGDIPDGDLQTFGIGGGYFTPGFQKTINGVVFNQFLQGLAVLNQNFTNRSINACLEDAVTHVLGHAIGLGHSGDSGALMYATLRSGCASGSSGLASDDIDGVRAIYPPVASGGSPPNAPTAITNSVTLDTVTLSWTPASTGGPAQSYILDAGTAPGVTNITSIVLNSPNTSTVVGAVPPGLYYVRVRARNALGTSGPSPDTAVTVGPCDAPGQPANVLYSTADDLVTISWTPPASGVTQGYWLYAGYAPGQSNALVTQLGPTPIFAGSAPFGTYYVRLAAWNSCAVGPTSPDLQVNVLPCTAAPLPPTGLSYTRTGNIVTLTWNNPASGSLPSRFEIHAGSAPGASNLIVFSTTNNATSIQTLAPPGTYYVRVKGVNNCGPSVDSNEIAVVVP